MSADSQSRSEAAARNNEQTFAKANEQIGASAKQYEFDEAVPFLCECSNIDCLETIALPLTTYREARERGDAFILRKGHNDPRVEQIVGSADGYVLVKKFS